MSGPDLPWMPEACTLPTSERPLRLAEFDDFLSTSARAQHRVSPTRLRWTADPGSEATIRDLARRETACCSFLDFGITRDATAVTVQVDVPATHVAVLDALEAGAEKRLRG